MINIFFICLHIYHHLYIINHCPWILSHRLIIKLAKAPEKRIVFQGFCPQHFSPRIMVHPSGLEPEPKASEAFMVSNSTTGANLFGYSIISN